MILVQSIAKLLHAKEQKRVHQPPALTKTPLISKVKIGNILINGYSQKAGHKSGEEITRTPYTPAD